MKTDFYSRIGSETKTFTVTGVLQLADQAKLGLDDPIAKFVDGVPEGDKITLRQLAQMQSGLFNYSESPEFQQAMLADPRRPFTPQELLNFAFAQPNAFPPGEGFEYCNTNTVLLGVVVEKVSGQPLHDYVRDHILTRLGMSHTSFPTTNAFPEPHAQGYTVQTADGKEANATDWNPSWGWAAGAMISTLDDMHIWAPALATGKLLTPHPPIPASPGIVSPGTWSGANATPSATTTSSSATTRLAPVHGNNFSRATTAAITTAHVMLIRPSANSVAISAQQQPTHQAPCSMPMRAAPIRPDRQEPTTNASGLRHFARQTSLRGVSW